MNQQNEMPENMDQTSNITQAENTVTEQKAVQFVELSMEKLKSVGMITPDSTSSQLLTEYRMIKRPLLKNAFDNEGVQNINNLIMVTSANPGEGKTFTTVNLAMSIAMERDRTVLLVDADVVRPSISGLLGIHREPGLVDYLLSEETELSDMLVRTNIPNLSILPAGRYHPHATELLASDNMYNLAKELSRRYPDRIVLFDSPPLLATSEACVLAGLVGQIVIVVDVEKTLQSKVREALTRLDEPRRVGFVMNKIPGGRGGGYGYYGYYGSYGAA